MKRIGILLGVFAVLVVVGSALTGGPRQTGQPVTATAPEEAKETPLTPAEKKAQQEKWFGAETITAAQKAVRREFKDPDSAQFKDVFANYTEAYGVVACGYVNAKNSFGAYTGYKAFVSGGKSVILEDRDEIKTAWASACGQ